jgi:glycosyltransferase involved in cell wall biosynthesis
MISIIIPAYNHRNALARTLESIRAQTCTDYEVIVVDDGSTDKPSELFSVTRKTQLDKQRAVGDQPIRLAYDDMPVLYLRHENQGANAARNRGFCLSQGDEVLFCDADVRMEPTMLARMHTALAKHPESAYAYSSFRFGFKDFALWPFDGETLRQMPYIHTTSLMRRSAFPGFDPTVKRLQDWDLYLTMLKEGRTGVWISDMLFSVETRKNGMSEWLPSFAYTWLPFLPAVRRYRRAARIIKKKHHLN